MSPQVLLGILLTLHFCLNLCLVAVITTDPLNTKYYTAKILHYIRLKKKDKVGQVA